MNTFTARRHDVSTSFLTTKCDTFIQQADHNKRSYDLLKVVILFLALVRHHLISSVLFSPGFDSGDLNMPKKD